MSLYLVALGAFLITSIVWIVILIGISDQWQDKVQILKAQRFSLEQLLTDCYEGRTEHVWQMRSDGVDVVVERGRPDLHRIQSELPEDDSDEG